MPYWAVARAVPQHDRLAAASVCQAGFEIFVPRIRERSGVRWRTTPLFGCYFFVRIVDRWRAVDRAIGVLGLVKCGEAPAKCPDAEVAALLQRSDADGIVRLAARSPLPSGTPRPVLSPGAAVTIAGGPFRGFTGL